MRGKHAKRAALRRVEEEDARVEAQRRREEELTARALAEEAERREIAALNAEVGDLRERLRLSTLEETGVLQDEIEGLRLEISELEVVSKREMDRRDKEYVVGLSGGLRDLDAVEEVVALLGGGENKTIATGVYHRPYGGDEAARVIQRARGLRSRASLDEARVQVRRSIERLIPTIEGEERDGNSPTS